jgi:hypothetical protein
MGDLEIKLKIGSHYQNLSLKSLHEQWKVDGLQSYSFSKAQLTRIRKHFEEFSSQLNPPIRPDTSSLLNCDTPTTISRPNSPLEQGDEYKELNLDVYTEDDFESPICTQLYYTANHQECPNYYQELLSAVQELRNGTSS